MTPCDHDKLEIHALIDGELDPANKAAVEERIAGCPDCMAEHAQFLALRDALRMRGAYASAPHSLKRRLKSVTPETESRERPAPAPARRAWVLPVGLASLGAVLGAAALTVVLVTPHPVVDTLTDDLVADHVRSLQVDHLVDVKTANRHVVKPWFNGKLDFSPPIVDLKPQGFPLAGGRLDYVDHRAIAAIVYRRGDHVINLFVWPEKGEKVSGPVRARDGYTLRHWRGDGMGFWAVSDVNPDDLAQFETLLTGRIVPSPPPAPQPQPARPTADD